MKAHTEFDRRRDTRMLVGLLGLAWAAACTPPLSNPPAKGALSAPIIPPEKDEGARVRAFVQVEDTAMGWLSAADPRLAARTGATAPDAVLAAIGQEAVLAEDAAAEIRGRSLDLFAFRARAHAIAEAAKLVLGFTDPLPERAPPESGLARPALERALLVRLIQEEQERTVDEAKLGDASGDLVRGILATWTHPAEAQEWRDRDAWVSRHLLEIRDALRSAPPAEGPFDLDVALYPLERVLSPLEFPRGAAALAQVRVVMDQDMRPTLPLATPPRLAHLTKAHLGIEVDPAVLVPRLTRFEGRLRAAGEHALATAGPDRPALEAEARRLLFVVHSCQPAPGTRVRAMAPPPERAAICGAIGSLAAARDATASLVALHDDVLLALAAVTTSPPPRTALLSKPEDDRVDELRRDARERPAVALGVALAAEMIYGAGDAAPRLAAWNALGDAPLDVVAAELALTPPPHEGE
jgi:hypothetical protein